jgi:hypothetical protein
MVSHARELQSEKLLSWKPADLWLAISILDILAMLLNEEGIYTVI